MDCDSASEGTSNCLPKRLPSSACRTRLQWGGFFQIYQPNKWKLKVAKAMAEREARIAAEAAATAAGLGADQHSQAPAALAGEATVTSSAAPTTVVKEAVAVSA
jgi:hypothetical protein